MKLFKYLDEKHAHDFVEKGKVLFRTLSYFMNTEHSEITDKYEGTLKYKPTGGLLITDSKTGQKQILPHAFESSTKADEIFIFCTSTTLSKDLFHKFRRSACVEITDVVEFRSLLNKALSHGRKKHPPNLLENHIQYYKETDKPAENWALPEQIIFRKLFTFSDEKEYRFAFSMTDALKFQNTSVTLTTEDRASNMLKHPERELTLGSLAQICKVHHHNS